MPRRGDGLYQRGSAWYLDFQHKGERHVVRLGRNISRTVAREIASVKRSQIVKGDEGIATKKKDILFDKAADAFLDWVEANRRPKTRKCYGEYTKQLRRSFAGKPLGSIHPFAIEKHKKMRVEEGARVSLNRELAVLKALFNKCITWKQFEGVNPVREVTKLEESKGRLRYLEPEEERRLLDAAAEPLRCMILVGIYTGLRLNSEALTLEWQDVNLPRGFLTVQAAYAKNGESRTVPLNSVVKGALQVMKGEREDTLHVFAKKDGSRYRSVRTAFETACRRASLTGVTLHLCVTRSGAVWRWPVLTCARYKNSAAGATLIWYNAIHISVLTTRRKPWSE